MKNLKYIAYFLTLLISGLCFSQEKSILNIPDILGYETLKCDFHLHTVFSDGQVWPSVRVDEAKRDGIDAISITDHIEYRPMLKYFFKDDEVNSDHNLPYEVAKERAINNDILLIRGAEITYTMPPGHFNVIFLSDINPLDTPWEEDTEDEPKQGWIETGLFIKNWKDAFYNAKRQGAFIYWNHPCWRRQQPDTTIWWQEHTWLLENNMMDGIEVVNGNTYCSEAHQWAIEKKLTIMAGSDSHGPIDSKQQRPLTLIFAKDNSTESIKEALIDRRSAVLYNNKLIGDQKFLNEIFFESIAIESVKKTNESFNVKINNQSGIPFELSKTKDNDKNIEISDIIIIPSNKQTTVTIFTRKEFNNNKLNLKFTVDNLLIAPEKGLPVDITFVADE